MIARRYYGVIAVQAGDVRREFASVETPASRELERAARLMAAQRARVFRHLAGTGLLVSVSMENQF